MSGTGGLASVRGIRTAIGAAVAAAGTGDPVAFEAAAARLAGQDQQRLRVVQGAIVRELLEDLHPDGLAGEDAQQVVQRCVTAAAGWYPAVDAEVLVTALLGALGAHDPDERPPVEAGGLAVHGALLIADLLAVPTGPPTPTDPIAARLERYLDSALAEIKRAETVELP